MALCSCLNKEAKVYAPRFDVSFGVFYRFEACEASGVQQVVSEENFLGTDNPLKLGRESLTLVNVTHELGTGAQLVAEI